jgi:hypothetical protein
MPTARYAVVVLGFLLLFTTGCGSSDTGAAGSFAIESGLPADAATISDVEGDVRDGEGERPPEGARVADITAAGIYLSEMDLTLAIQQADPIPSELVPATAAEGGSEWLVYTLFIADAQGDHLYMPRVMLEDSEWRAEVFDRGSGKGIPVDGLPDVSGSTLIFAFPLALMPDLPSSFKWAAATEWGMTDAADASGLLTFTDQATEDATEGYGGPYPIEWATYPE